MASNVRVTLKLETGDVTIGMRNDGQERTVADYINRAVQKHFGRQCAWVHISDIDDGYQGRIVRRLPPTSYRSETKDVPRTGVIVAKVCLPDFTSKFQRKREPVYVKVHLMGENPVAVSVNVHRVNEDGTVMDEKALCKLAAEHLFSKCGAAIRRKFKGLPTVEPEIKCNMHISFSVEC